jgi:quercetin dioxygenase-like cupin family protein
LASADTEVRTVIETSGERIQDPIHRVAYSFERDGERLWISTWLEDGGHLPEHYHPSLEEYWEVLDGAVALKLDGAWRDLVPDDGRVRIAPNVKHELENVSGAPARLRTEVIPAGRLEEFLTESARGAREGLYNARNMPTSLRGALWIADLAYRFRDETVMCSPPPAVQRVVLPVIARRGAWRAWR